MNCIRSFWTEFRPQSDPPYVHPSDEAHLLLPRRKIVLTELPNGIESFISDLHREPKGHSLQLGLYPVPYLGNLEQAEVILLLLNPGLGPTDFLAETANPEFKRRLLRTIRQDFRDELYPFLHLDPNLCWHGGFIWWERKLRRLAQILAAEMFDQDYATALKYLSGRIAAIELVPYHSATFGSHDLLNVLPSARRAREWVHAELLPRAARDECTIVVTRQTKAWGIEPNTAGCIVYEGSETRGASISLNTRGGQAILAQLRRNL